MPYIARLCAGAAYSEMAKYKVVIESWTMEYDKRILYRFFRRSDRFATERAI